MKSLHPEEYNFYPQTWNLPHEAKKLKQDWEYIIENVDPNCVLIVKPEASCQGKGIYLVREVDDIDFEDHCVVQVYINKPVLMERMKFDLRLYVLVLGIDPLRVYLSK
jgi:tubulin polyglutamylase TTLL6/13